MKSFLKQKLLGGIIFGLGIIISLTGIGIIYSSWSGYSDLPTVSSGSGLTATSWNNLVGMVNKSIKQDSEIITVDNTNSRIGIGKSSPSTKLDIGGSLRADSYKMKTYTIGGPNAGSFSLSSANTRADLDLILTIPLTSSAMVTCNYNITSNSAGAQHLVTRLVYDGIIKSSSITGQAVYRSNSGLYSETLVAGTHIIKVQYRSPDGGINNPSLDDRENRFLQCIVYGDQ